MIYKKKDILLFACIEENIGDDLFIQTICERYPSERFIISSAAKYGSLKRIHNLQFSKLLYWWLIFDASTTKNRMKKKVIATIKKILTVLLGKHDIGVYIVGNAFKNDNYCGKRQLEWLNRRRYLSKEFYLISTNFGPYNDERWREDAKIIFKNVTSICFRDMQSYELFSDLANVRYAPDAILTVSNILNEEKENLVIISVIDCMFEARPQWIKTFTEVYEEKIVEMTKFFVQRGFKVVLLNSNTCQDGPASKRILQKIDSNNVTIFDYAGDIDELKKLYAKTKYVIGTRLHTIILAWLYRIPVYPIIYDIKVNNMLQSYNYSGESIDIANISELNVDSIFSELQKEYGIKNDVFSDAQKQFDALDKRLYGTYK